MRARLRNSVARFWSPAKAGAARAVRMAARAAVLVLLDMISAPLGDMERDSRSRIEFLLPLPGFLSPRQISSMRRRWAGGETRIILKISNGVFAQPDELSAVTPRAERDKTRALSVAAREPARREARHRG